ncbi:MAG: ABC transporter substrate-binding protein [Sporolactobacillus sp.]
MTRKLLALLLTVIMATALVGCGSGRSQNGKNGAKAPDQNLVVAFNNDIQSLDPQNASDTLSITVIRTMYEALVSFDKNQKIIPQLATSYKVGKNNLTYTFKLRKNVKFHDGTDFNAAAFKANYERDLKNTKLREHILVSTWASVQTPDKYTVVIKLKQPNSTFINKMTMFDIISPKLIKRGDAAIAKEPDGTGAYKFESRVAGDHVTVVPFASYWNGKPKVKSLTFKAVPEDGARVAMLQTGEADYIYPMPTTQAAKVNGTRNIKVDTQPSAIERYVTLNTMIPQFKSKKVRQAMNYAINKDAYIKTVFKGYASQVYSAYPSTVQYYSPQKPYTFNLKKAKQLMAEAGYKNGFSVTLWGDNTTTEQIGEQFVQQQLAQIGIKVKVLPMEPNTISNKIFVPKNKATINMWYVNWSPSSFDADGALRALLYSKMIPPTSANTAYYNNSTVDKLLDEGLATANSSKLKKIYARVQKRVWDDAPWLFLGSDKVISGQKTYLTGVTLAPDGSLDLTKAELK